jgi:flagellar assembly protein FliH
MSTEAFAHAVYPRLREIDGEAERRRAQQRGYAAGHAEGFRVAAAEAAATAAQARSERAAADAARERALASALGALESATAALTARVVDLARADEQTISTRAIDLAEMILGEVLAAREFAATAAVRRALAAADGRQPIEVRLSVDDERIVRERSAAAAGFSVVADAALAAGDAVVVLPDGMVDARIGAALERARRTLDGVSR